MSIQILIYYFPTALLVMFVLLVVQLQMRVELRSVLMGFGHQSVVLDLVDLKLM